jgi:hypothetical protein
MLIEAGTSRRCGSTLGWVWGNAARLATAPTGRTELAAKLNVDGRFAADVAAHRRRRLD